MKQTKMLVSFAALLTMMSSVVAGCSTSGGSTGQPAKDAGAGAAKFEGYPIQTNKTLTYWAEMNANIIDYE